MERQRAFVAFWLRLRSAALALNFADTLPRRIKSLAHTYTGYGFICQRVKANAALAHHSG